MAVRKDLNLTPGRQVYTCIEVGSARENEFCRVFFFNIITGIESNSYYCIINRSRNY
jgi:hypothetical protein